MVWKREVSADSIQTGRWRSHGRLAPRSRAPPWNALHRGSASWGRRRCMTTRDTRRFIWSSREAAAARSPMREHGEHAALPPRSRAEPGNEGTRERGTWDLRRFIWSSREAAAARSPMRKHGEHAALRSAPPRSGDSRSYEAEPQGSAFQGGARERGGALPPVGEVGVLNWNQLIEYLLQDFGRRTVCVDRRDDVITEIVQQWL